MKKLGLGALHAATLGVFAAAAAPAAFADPWNMRQGVTEISQSIYSLHMLMFTICAIIGVLVFGTMFASILTHRRTSGA